MKKKIVVITGATAGVGRAAARAFAASGASVALLARDQAQLADTCKEIEALGGTALALCVDVADANAIEAAAEQVEPTLGPIDVWVNNARATIFAPLEEIKPDEFSRVTAVTYLGTALSA